MSTIAFLDRGAPIRCLPNGFPYSYYFSRVAQRAASNAWKMKPGNALIAIEGTAQQFNSALLGTVFGSLPRTATRNSRKRGQD